jgi:hypothetical protein
VAAALGTVALSVKENQVSADVPSALVDVALIVSPVALVIDFVHRRKPRLDKPLRALLLFAALVGGVLAAGWARIWVGQDAAIALAPVVCAALAARRLATFLAWLTAISCIAVGVSFFVGPGFGPGTNRTPLVVLGFVCVSVGVLVLDLQSRLPQSADPAERWYKTRDEWGEQTWWGMAFMSLFAMAAAINAACSGFLAAGIAAALIAGLFAAASILVGIARRGRFDVAAAVTTMLAGTGIAGEGLAVFRQRDFASAFTITMAGAVILTAGAVLLGFTTAPRQLRAWWNAQSPGPASR